MKLVSILLIILLNFGCQKIQNSVSSLVLDCGDDLPPQAQNILQAVTPQDTAIGPTGFEAVELREDAETTREFPLFMTQKGCVVYQEDSIENIVIRSRNRENKLAALITPGDLPFIKKVKLKDMSSVRPQLLCSNVIYSAGNLPDLIQVSDDEAARAMNIQLSFTNGQALSHETRLYPYLRSKQNKPGIPLELPDGSYEIKIKLKNFLEPDPDHHMLELGVCRLVLDSTPPRASIEFFTETNQSDDVVLSPGQRISLAVEDGNVDQLSYCLLPESEKKFCEAEDWLTVPAKEKTIQAPDYGKWTIYVKGKDQSANDSEIVSKRFMIVNNALISDIQNDLKLTTLMARTDYKQSQIHLLRAFKKYDQLYLSEEKQQIEGAFHSTLGAHAHKYLEVKRHALGMDSAKNNARIAQGMQQKDLVTWLLSPSKLALYAESGAVMDEIEIDNDSLFKSPIYPSPNGKWAAFYVLKSDQFHLQIWDRSSGKLNLLAEAQVQKPVLELDKISWLEDQSQLIMWTHGSGETFGKVYGLFPERRTMEFQQDIMMPPASRQATGHRFKSSLSTDHKWLAIIDEEQLMILEKDRENFYRPTGTGPQDSSMVDYEWYDIMELTDPKNDSPKFLLLARLKSQKDLVRVAVWHPNENGLQFLPSAKDPLDDTAKIDLDACSKNPQIFAVPGSRSSFLLDCKHPSVAGRMFLELKINEKSFKFAWNPDIYAPYGDFPYVWNEANGILAVRAKNELDVFSYDSIDGRLNSLFLGSIKLGELSNQRFISSPGRDLLVSLDSANVLRFWRSHSMPNFWNTFDQQKQIEWIPAEHGQLLLRSKEGSNRQNLWARGGNLASSSLIVPDFKESSSLKTFESPSRNITIGLSLGQFNVYDAKNHSVSDPYGPFIKAQEEIHGNGAGFRDFSFSFDDQAFVAAETCNLVLWNRGSDGLYVPEKAFGYTQDDCYMENSLKSLKIDGQSVFLVQRGHWERFIFDENGLLVDIAPETPPQSYTSVYDFSGQLLYSIDGLNLLSGLYALSKEAPTLAFLSSVNGQLKLYRLGLKELQEFQVAGLPSQGKFLNLAISDDGAHLVGVVEIENDPNNVNLMSWERGQGSRYHLNGQAKIKARIVNRKFILSWWPERQSFLLASDRDAELSEWDVKLNSKLHWSLPYKEIIISALNLQGTKITLSLVGSQDPLSIVNDAELLVRKHSENTISLYDLDLSLYRRQYCATLKESLFLEPDVFEESWIKPDDKHLCEL